MQEIIAIGLMAAFFILGRIYGQIFCPKINDDKEVIIRERRQRATKQNKKKEIKIDESKVVVGINTSGIEKKFDSFGETKVSQENINSSIDKLKGLKKCQE